MSQNEVTTAKSAVTSGSYTNDDNLIKSLSDDRDQAFETQLTDCMERSGGLTTSRYAYFIDLASLAEKVTTELAFVKIAEKKKNELITQCQGMGHSHNNPPWKCTENVVIEDNEWIP